jgi:hypothetical protein
MLRDILFMVASAPPGQKGRYANASLHLRKKGTVPLFAFGNLRSEGVPTKSKPPPAAAKTARRFRMWASSETRVAAAIHSKYPTLSSQTWRTRAGDFARFSVIADAEAV